MRKMKGMEILIWVMPDKRDERFSRNILKRLKAFVKSLGVEEGFMIEIWEQYRNEDKPHYHMKIIVGCYNNPTNKGYDVGTSYTATANGEEHEGCMMICFRSIAPDRINTIVGTGAFLMYDEAIRKDYPGWKTNYVNFDLDLVYDEQ